MLPLLTLRLLHGAFCSGPRTDALMPVINRRVIVEVDTLTLVGMNPWPAGYVRNAVVIAPSQGEVSRRLFITLYRRWVSTWYLSMA